MVYILDKLKNLFYLLELNILHAKLVFQKD